MKSKFECFIMYDTFPSVLSFQRGGQMPLRALVFVRVMGKKTKGGAELGKGEH